MLPDLGSICPEKWNDGSAPVWNNDLIGFSQNVKGWDLRAASRLKLRHAVAFIREVGGNQNEELYAWEKSGSSQAHGKLPASGETQNAVEGTCEDKKS